MNAAADQHEDARRIQRALLAHLRQEFTAPASAIVGYTEILIEEAREHSLDGYLPDLERIAVAGRSLQSLLQSVLMSERSSEEVIFNRAALRHDLRTPINAIKGYGEMLAEDAEADGHESLRDDLAKLLAASDGMLKLIDSLVDFNIRAPENTAAKPATDGIVGAVRALRTAGQNSRLAEIKGRILVVDDIASNRDLLRRQLTRAGHTIGEADGGHAALAKAASEPFDLILLDLIMPDLSGFEVLLQLKREPATREIPVIIMSALDDLDSIIRCIEAGALDYLMKPVDPTLLHARIGASLENKFLRDREKEMMDEIHREKARYEELLLSILPRSIVDRINRGEQMIADHVDAVTILFADIVGFTKMASGQSAAELVQFLNSIFTAFDVLTQRFGGEKIKTIGDAYMVAYGLPDAREDHAEAAVQQARAMLDEIRKFKGRDGAAVNLRIGLHTGPAVAGVIGQRKFSFDVWGNTVNIASRMESHGEPGKIHVSCNVAETLAGKFSFIERGLIEVKGTGPMRTFFLGDPA